MQREVEGSQVQGSRPAGADGSSHVNWSSYWVPGVSATGQGAHVKYYAAPGRFGTRDGVTADGTHALFSINLRSASLPLFLPLLQLTPWPASAPLLKYSNTNGFWQPAIMRNNRPVYPSHAEQIWGAGASSSNSAPSLSSQDSWQFQILGRRRWESGRGLAAGERGLCGRANMSRWWEVTVQTLTTQHQISSLRQREDDKFQRHKRPETERVRTQKNGGDKYTEIETKTSEKSHNQKYYYETCLNVKVLHFAITMILMLEG